MPHISARGYDALTVLALAGTQTSFAVFYQDDSFGKNGLEGVRLALDRRGLDAGWRKSELGWRRKSPNKTVYVMASVRIKMGINTVVVSA